MNKEEAIKAIQSFIGWFKTDSRIYKALQMAIQALSQEQKSGIWIGIDEEPHEDYECSCCGYVVSTFTANIEPHTEYKYCPNCGAKMEREVKE